MFLLCIIFYLSPFVSQFSRYCRCLFLLSFPIIFILVGFHNFIFQICFTCGFKDSTSFLSIWEALGIDRVFSIPVSSKESSVFNDLRFLEGCMYFLLVFYERTFKVIARLITRLVYVISVVFVDKWLMPFFDLHFPAMLCVENIQAVKSAIFMVYLFYCFYSLSPF